MTEQRDAVSVAARNATQAMGKLQIANLFVNVVGGISLTASIAAPFILFYLTGNWINLLFLPLCPIILAIFSFARLKKIESNGFIFLILIVNIVFSRYLTPPHLVYSFITWGVGLSYYTLFFIVPSLKSNWEHCSSVFKREYQRTL
jgi:hypothetical protein